MAGFSPVYLLFAVIPLLIAFVPRQTLEPYRLWSPASLNSRDEFGRLRGWRNMGYWGSPETFREHIIDFSQANENLARKLLEFSDAKLDGNVLDIAHGYGESILIHLESNPKRIDALTSLEDETLMAQSIVDWSRAIKGMDWDTVIEWYTGSATYREGKDLGHPLYPMKGFLGDGPGGEGMSGPVVADDDGEDVEGGEDVESGNRGDRGAGEAQDAHKGAVSDNSTAQPVKYDLVYILDAIYHFPPSVPSFLSTVLPALKPGGVVAYTDVIPPSSWSRFPWSWFAYIPSYFLAVPAKNLHSRPASLDAYRAQLEEGGFVDVKVEDWSEFVFYGLTRTLFHREKDSKSAKLFQLGAQGLEIMRMLGWKFIAVRAERPA